MLVERWPARVALLAALLVLCVSPAYLAYATTPLMPLALAVGAGYFVLACVSPGWALVLGCVLAPLEAYQVPLSALGAVSPTEMAFLAIAAGWAWRAMTRPDVVVFPRLGDAPAITFVLALLPGLAVGADSRVVLKLVLMWSAFFVVHQVVREIDLVSLRRMLWALGIGAALLGLLGIASYVTGGGARLSGGGTTVSGRASSGIDDPNYYAAYVLVAATPLLAMAVGGRVRWRPVALACGAAAALGLVLSLSRGGILGLALALVVIVLSWSRTRWVTAGVIVVAVATTVFNVNPILRGNATEAVSERLASTTVESSNNKRLLLWERSLGVIDDHKAFGIGALQFKQEANRLGLTQNGSPLQNVHNTPLNLAVELGLLGLLAWLAWVARIARDLVGELRRRRPETFALTVGVTAALAGYLLQALTLSQYQVQVVHATFFVLAGAAARLRTAGRRLDRGVAATAA